MNVLKAPLKELGAYSEIQSLLSKNRKVLLTGCVDAQKLHMMSGISDGFNMKIIATYSEQKAKELYDDLNFYWDDEKRIKEIERELEDMGYSV